MPLDAPPLGAGWRDFLIHLGACHRAAGYCSPPPPAYSGACFWALGVSERREAILRVSVATSLQPSWYQGSPFPGWNRVGPKV